MKRKPLQPDEVIYHVYVTPRGQPNYLYTCQCWHTGWRCGICGRGNLGPIPKRGQKCRVCLSTVYEVRAMRGRGDDAKMRLL